MPHAFSVAVTLLVSFATHAEELPSPDAMWLGQRLQPRALIDGYREGLAKDAIESTCAPAAKQPALHARARRALAPLLEEAFPPEFLAGLGAQFLARRFSAEELRSLRSWEESPLGQKLHQLGQRELPAAGSAAREQGAGTPPTSLTTQEQAQIDEFARTPLGAKVAGGAQELYAFFLDQLDRHWTSVRGELEPRLRGTAQAACKTSDARSP